MFRHQADLQRLFQIFAKIVGVFQPHRQAQQARRDAQRGARLRRQLLVGGGLGMGDQALGVAQIVGDVDQLQRIGAAGTPPACRPRPRTPPRRRRLPSGRGPDCAADDRGGRDRAPASPCAGRPGSRRPACAFSQCAFMRRSSVSRLFRCSQALKGLIEGPVLRRKTCRCSSRNSWSHRITPPSARPWPSIYLVEECTTIWAPNSIGRCSAGLAKALSTTSSAPCLSAILATAFDVHDRQGGIGRRFQEQHAGLGPHRRFPGARASPPSTRV